MEATKIVYGVKYYIKEVGTEFDLFQTLSGTETFWNNKSFDKIIPMKILKGLVNENTISQNENGEIVFNNNYDSFKTIETIKTNA
jgi:hypothetical protein